MAQQDTGVDTTMTRFLTYLGGFTLGYGVVRVAAHLVARSVRRMAPTQVDIIHVDLVACDACCDECCAECDDSAVTDGAGADGAATDSADTSDALFDADLDDVAFDNAPFDDADFDGDDTNYTGAHRADAHSVDDGDSKKM